MSAIFRSINLQHWLLLVVRMNFDFYYVQFTCHYVYRIIRNQFNRVVK